jgi:hypothetical protein
LAISPWKFSWLPVAVLVDLMAAQGELAVAAAVDCCLARLI